MNPSILTSQKTAIITLMKTMTVSNGYNFDWPLSNNTNMAIDLFPRALVYRPSEENLDILSGLGSGDYTNRVNYRINVAGKINFSSKNPVFDIEEVFAQCLDDLKRLFGKTVNRSVMGTMDSFLYVGYEHEYKAVETFVPTGLITKWSATYSQGRQDPTKYAGG